MKHTKEEIITTDSDSDSDSSDDSSTNEPTQITFKSKTPEYVKQYNQKYYAKTKEGTLAKLKEKVVCECGCILTQGRLNKHRKTKKHEKEMTKKTSS